MAIDDITILRRLIVPYRPVPGDRSFVQRVLTQSQDGVEVSVTVLAPLESRRYFRVPMARRAIQPLWRRIVNGGKSAYRLNLVGIDPNYYSPYEAAAANHFSSG